MLYLPRLSRGSPIEAIRERRCRGNNGPGDDLGFHDDLDAAIVFGPERLVECRSIFEFGPVRNHK
jgi:hypothetical protein